MPALHVVTPVWESPTLSARAGRPVLLKMEALQPASSFKMRGIGNLCQQAVDQGATGLVCASGGNAGLATAYAGRKLGVPTTIVVPSTTSAHARAVIAREGAVVIEHGSVWDEAQQLAEQLAAEHGYAAIHSFDHPAVWDGNATLTRELATQIEKPAAVVLSVGGGGLLCGAVQGLQDNGWHDVPVIAVETHGAASLAAALQAGAPVTLDKIRSIAVTLGARRVAQRCLELAAQHPIIAQQVSDRQALDACFQFADEHRLLVEPACGAALAALSALPDGLADGPILAVVCGGAGVSRELFARWDAQLGPSA
jgi:L-serine/L-threonine ammonia-lyase